MLSLLPLLSLACIEITLPTARVADVPPPAPVGSAERPAEVGAVRRARGPAGGPFKNRLALTLTPSRTTGPRVDRLDVTLDFSGDVTAEGAPLVLSLRDVDLGETGWASRIDELGAEDEQGPLTLRRSDGGWRSGGMSRTVWTSDRPRRGDVSVHYRVDVPRPTQTRSNFGLHGDSVGLGGPARTFLLMPLGDESLHVDLRWQLGGLARGASGACRHGEGNVVFDATPRVLEREIFVAGPLITTTLPDGDGTLKAIWLGEPGFDRERLLPLVQTVRRAAEKTFGMKAPRPLIFVRTQEDAPGGSGEADDDALTLLLSPRIGFSTDTRMTIAHETLHAWLGHALRLVGDPEPTWFTEGFTVHYARKLLTRAGVISPDELLVELARHGALYAQLSLTQPSKVATALPRTADASPSLVPYVHGSFYAAELEASLLARSHGTRSLDDLVRDVFHREAGFVPVVRFRDRVREALGEDGAARFDAVIGQGSPAEPPSNAFGACFRRVPLSPLSGVRLLAWERSGACDHRGRPRP